MTEESGGSEESKEPSKATNRSGKTWKQKIGWPWSLDRWIGLGGIVVAIVVGWYFYDLSERRPRLTIQVNPTKNEFQRPDDPDFAFTYRGKPVSGNAITAMQVAVWNDGTESIKADNILEPIYVQLATNSPILVYSVKKVSRDVCKFEADPSALDRETGRIPLKWKILEPGDGAIIQILYVGDAKQDAYIGGVVEGQKMLRKVSDAPHEADPFFGTQKPMSIGFIFGTVAGGMAAANLVLIFQRKRRKHSRVLPVFFFIAYLIPIIILAILFSNPSWLPKPGPPFGW